MTRRDFCSDFSSAIGVQLLSRDGLLGYAPLGQAGVDSLTIQSDMAQRLENISAKKGFLYAPRFLGALLALLARISTGATTAEIRRFIGVRVDSDFRTLAFAYSEGISQDRRSPVSNRCSLWLRAGTAVSRNLLDDARERFNADVFTIGFPEARIADWVTQHTAYRMERYHVPSGVEFLAINAGVFKLKWQISFDPKLTKTKSFIGSARTAQVHFMQRNGNFELLENGEFSILRLRLQNQFSLYFGLQSTSSHGKVAKFLDYALHSELFDHRRVLVIIPRLSLNEHTDLKRSLIGAGLHAPFSSKAQFDAIGNARITDAYQDIALHIDEVGVEAESATTFVQQQGISLEPAVFNANRPFYYCLVQDKTDRVFFVGSVENM